MAINIGDYVHNFVTQNATLSREELLVKMNNELVGLRQGGAKISPKQIAQASAMLQNEMDAMAVQAKVTAPKTAKVVKKANAQVAAEAYKNNLPRISQNRYEMMQITGNGLGERRKAFQEELETAFGTKEVHRQVKPSKSDLRRQALVDGMVDKEHSGAATFEEHLDDLKKNGKINEYDEAIAEMKKADVTPNVSSKAKKAAKKVAEEKSAVEHARFRNTKQARNARYATNNEFMTNVARKNYEKVAKQCNGNMSVTVNELAPKSAKDSMDVFLKHDVVPQEVAKDTTKEAETLLGKIGKFAKTKKGKVGIAIATSVAVITGITALAKHNNARNAELQEAEEPKAVA